MGVFQNNLMGAAAAAASAGGGDFYSHQIANSVRFDRPNASKMSRSLGTATANTKWTFSTWVKFSSFPAGTTDDRCLLGATGSTYSLGLGLTSSTANEPQLLFIDYPSSAAGPNAGGIQSLVYLKRLSRDLNAWQHIVVNQDTTQGTASDRIKFYINGELQTDFDDHSSGGSATPFYPSQNSATINDSIHTLLVGVDNADNAANTLDGYMAETYFIDGTAYAGSDFGETKNGVWIPKDASGLTFGNNGFYLNYASSGDLGNDVSGNNNDYTVSNISAHDQMLDSPTFNSDSNGGNFATIGPLWKTSDMTFSEGNLKWTCSTNQRGLMSNWAVPIGTKAYWEYIPVTFGGNTSNGDESWIGINQGIAALVGGDRGGKETAYAYGTSNGYKTILNSASSYGATIRANDVVGVAVDRVNHTINFSKNNSWQGTFAISATMDLFPFIGSGGGSSSATGTFNFGQDGTFAGTKTAGGNADGNGYGNFLYTPPTGFLAMCAGNLPTADAVDPAQTDDNIPTKLFSATTYTGNGSASARNIDTGVASDWVWIKNRGAGSTDHMLYDSSRGVGKYLRSNKSDAEDTSGTSLSAFNSDGFQLSDNGSYLNAGSNTYVAWNWRTNGGTTASNTTGGTNSVTQVDPSGAFSIVTYTGFSGASGSSTVGHGLAVAPAMIIHKSRTRSSGWWTQVPNLLTDAGYFLNLENHNAQTDLNSYGTMNVPTTSVFTINGVDGVGGESANYVAYCFANIEGYCKVGSYVGNGSTDGAFVYTGLKPAWVMTKMIDGGAEWTIFDTKRDPYNLSERILQADIPDAERTDLDEIDILSNGFKCKYNGGRTNQSGKNYIYLAFAENPFKYATAR